MKQLIILILIALGVVFLGNDEQYVEIPASSIRMRVIAASDSEKDQSNKEIVKSFVEEALYDIVGENKNEQEIEESISLQKDKIDEEIKMKIQNVGLDVGYHSNFGYNYFPEKEFKGLTYKAGYYKSFVVTLDEGKGENWWCVLYPPLCLIDENKEDYEYHSLIKDTILKYN